MRCPLCSAEQECLHKAKEFDMDTLWEEILDFGYPSFLAYPLDEKEVHRQRIKRSAAGEN